MLLLCNSCNRRNCSHCKVAESVEFLDNVPVLAPLNSNAKERVILYSTLPYSIDFGGFVGDLLPERTDSVNAAIKSRSIKGSSYFHENFPEKMLREPIHNYTCCPNPNLRINRTNTIFIFSQAEIIMDFITPIYDCDVCKKTFHFEGRDYGLLNFNDSHFFCVELFYSLLDLKYRAGLSTYAWWNSKTEMYIRQLENDRAKMRVKLERLSGTINQFFHHFLKLIEYAPDVMKCCDGSPDIITLDGIVMSIESKRIKDAKLSQPWITETNFCRKSTRKERNVLQLTTEEKKLFDQYTSAGISTVELLKFYSEYPRNPIIELMVISANTTNGLSQCTEILKPFFRSCRKNIMPATSFLPKSLWNAVDLFLNDRIAIFELVTSLY